MCDCIKLFSFINDCFAGISGALPFQDEQEILTREVEFEATVWESKSNQLQNLIRAMLMKDVDNRPSVRILCDDDWLKE